MNLDEAALAPPLTTPWTSEVSRTQPFPVPNAHRWSPDDPFLYNLRVTLRDGAGAQVDRTLHSFGMREVGKKMVNGVLRPTLNGKFVFQIGTLDQGFWPDGLYTAPTDAALASDLQKHKDLGFNMVRKHIKAEPQRFLGQFLRHADARVRNSPNDGSDVFKGDATWCARPGLSGKGVTLESFNFGGAYLRHFEAGVYLASGAPKYPPGAPAGPNRPQTLTADSSWNLVAPWAP